MSQFEHLLYVLSVIKSGFMRFVTHCILFLFTFYTSSQLFWKWGCRIAMKWWQEHVFHLHQLNGIMLRKRRLRNTASGQKLLDRIMMDMQLLLKQFLRAHLYLSVMCVNDCDVLQRCKGLRCVTSLSETQKPELSQNSPPVFRLRWATQVV